MYREKRVEEKIITLEEYENSQGCLDSYEAASIVKLLCLTLAGLHNAKITYRELCPANILLVCKNGQQDGDFTEVRLAESEAPRKYREGATEDTVLMGIERYAAPEQYGFAQSTPATDIFAVGVIFNEMLTGKTPEEERAFHPVCAYMIGKCCSLDWRKRYKNVNTLLKDIEWYLSHRQSGYMAWKLYKNRKLLAFGAAVLAVCVGMLLGTGFIMRNIQKDGNQVAIQEDKKEEVKKEEVKKEEAKKEETKEKYQKYTVKSNRMVVYYPEGFHYSSKTEKEHSTIVGFSSDTGDTGMLSVAVLDYDGQYTLEEGAEILAQEIISMYPGGEVTDKEADGKQIKIFYKTTVKEEEWVVGVQAQLEQNDEKMVAVLGLFRTDWEKQYREYFDTMMKRVEY